MIEEGQGIRTMHDDLSRTRRPTRKQPTAPRRPTLTLTRPTETKTFPLPAKPRSEALASTTGARPIFGGPARTPRPRPNLVHTPRHAAPSQVHGAVQLPSGKRRRQLRLSIILALLALGTIVFGSLIAFLTELR